MKPHAKELLRKQLDRQLARVRRAHSPRPTRGWIRTIREALGMSGRQLAERMGISPPSLVRIEKAEPGGRTTLRTLERAADAMDCDLVYAFVPRGTTLEALVWERARAVAEKIVDDVAANMSLENQSVDDSFRKREAHRIAAELVRLMSREIWDG